MQIPTTDGLADAFVACPDHGERYPGVLMYPDAALRPHWDRLLPLLTRSLAKG